MPFSVTITYPMPGATLTPLFNVCGTAIVTEILKEFADAPDRNAQLLTTPLITVTVTKGNVVVATAIASFCPSGGGWQAIISGVGPDTGYTVTATMSLGANVVSHAIEWVDVSFFPLMMFSVICCPLLPPAPPQAGDEYTEESEDEGESEGAGNRVTLLPASAGRTPVTLSGTYADPSADDMFGVVRKVVETLTATPLPGGGTHYHVTYRQGGALPGKYGSLETATDWELADIEVEPKTFIMFHLKRWGHVIAQTSSGLF